MKTDSRYPPMKPVPYQITLHAFEPVEGSPLCAACGNGISHPKHPSVRDAMKDYQRARAVRRDDL